ncbi:MAG: cyclic nucleotide-binding domain-containing protein [Thermodesulfobacteriota bacterium]|nr:cyclic nucleotide-binding domain-containing protein [Thermodesulfobacteriota bacterium]
MLELINHPENKKYLVEFRSGDVIFLEGDETTDLYVLISGHVILIKGNMNISEISEPGSIFGEMAYLLNDKGLERNNLGNSDPKCVADLVGLIFTKPQA